MNLYLTIEQYLSQSFPYFLEHLIEGRLSSPSTTSVPARRRPLKVASTPVDEDGDEEDAVKVRDRSSGADDSTPEEAHGPIGDVVLVMSNVNRATRCATNQHIRVCGSTSTIHSLKGGFCRHSPKIMITIGERKVATHERSERR